MGAEVVLLHPDGGLNMSFFSETIARQQVTYLNIHSSLLTILTDCLSMTNNKEYSKTLRCVSFRGRR